MNKKGLCDVIIPVYNAPQWVSLCVYSLFENSDLNTINKVIFIDDCSNKNTKDLLENIKNKYKNKIEIITNKENKGFVKNCNAALKISVADYILLLNTDCIITKNTIEKMINHIENDKRIGLICPVSSNAANLTLDMFEGFNFMQMNKLLETKFSKMNFDACTVVGNCLMISRDCFLKTGYLDEIYGTGYGEETDYQFKAMERGFLAKVAIDTYVFHKSEVSFGTTKEKQEKLNHNREIFFSRWKDKYESLLKKYSKNDPIKYIHENLTIEDKKPTIDTGFYLTDIIQNAGGVHVVIDMINYMCINGLNANLMYDNMGNYEEIMLFSPININKLNQVNLNKIVSTIYTSAFKAKNIADNLNIPFVSLIQGNETLFENGKNFRLCELSYKLPDEMICISDYLKKMLKNDFNRDAKMINNGINTMLLNTNKTNKKAKVITMVLRNSPMKGDWLLLDILKKIISRLDNIEINLIYMSNNILFPECNKKNIKINKYLGPLKREEIAKILKKSDIFIDSSLNEGFGLLPLEAMMCGCVPIVSNSLGNNSYIKNGKNGYLIKEMNDTEKYLSKIDEVIKDDNLFMELRDCAQKTALEFDQEVVYKKYTDYFKQGNIIHQNETKLTEEDKEIMQKYFSVGNNSKVKKIAFTMAKILPKRIKRMVKKIIVSAYNTVSH